MESGENPEEFKDLIHSKFWKAKRGLLQLSGSTSTASGQAKRSSSLETTDYENPPKHSTTLRHQTSLPLPPSKLATTTSPSPETSQSQTHQLKLDPRHPLPFYNKSPIRTPTQPFGSPGTVLPSPATTHTTPSIVPRTFHCEVFRFDSTDRERYSCSAISEEEEVFSPGASPALSTKSYDSPLIVLDSPAITISKLHLKDEPGSSSGTVESQMESQHHLMAARVHAGVATAMLQTSSGEQGHGHFGIPSSPISPLTPNTPLSPSPLFTDQIFQQGFLAELYKRRCHSDSDLPLTPEACRNEPTDLSMSGPTPPSAYIKPRKPIPHPLTIPTKGGSLESEHSTPQDSPLDLSIRGLHHGERFGSGSTSCESLSSRFLSSLAIPPNSAGFSPAVIRGDIASPNTRNSVALRYNLDVSPVVEQIPAGADLAFVCPMCGQMFSLHDRLAKHMASRHKSKPHDPNKSYPCDVCHRSFARSDMLTRHMRLHTGVKPYTCRVCGQVFSRSDHLSTHQRTHTGEKPYKCPQCPYSACRRDMITRHLRTHTRNSSSSSSELQTPNSASLSSASDSHSIDDRSKSSSGKGRENVPIKLERMESDPPMVENVGIVKMELSSSPSIHQYSSRPPSVASSITLDSPTSTLSPAAQLHLSSLSVNSPSMDSPSQTKE